MIVFGFPFFCLYIVLLRQSKGPYSSSSSLSMYYYQMCSISIAHLVLVSRYTTCVTVDVLGLDEVLRSSHVSQVKPHRRRAFVENRSSLTDTTLLSSSVLSNGGQVVVWSNLVTTSTKCHRLFSFFTSQSPKLLVITGLGKDHVEGEGNLRMILTD